MKHPIEMPNRNPPKRIVEQLIQLDSNSFTCWRADSFTEAEKVFRNELSLREDIENEENRGIHKGGTLFDIGRSIIFQGKAEEVIYCFLSSYVEDTLSVGLGEESDAEPTEI